ncbi:uncharacterized protein LOC144578584 [Callithrix jacchus]
MFFQARHGGFFRSPLLQERLLATGWKTRKKKRVPGRHMSEEPAQKRLCLKNAFWRAVRFVEPASPASATSPVLLYQPHPALCAKVSVVGDYNRLILPSVQGDPIQLIQMYVLWNPIQLIQPSVLRYLNHLIVLSGGTQYNLFRCLPFSASSTSFMCLS